MIKFFVVLSRDFKEISLLNTIEVFMAKGSFVVPHMIKFYQEQLFYFFAHLQRIFLINFNKNMLNPNDIFAQIGFVVDSSPLKSSRRNSKNLNNQQYSPQKQIISKQLSPERQHKIPQYITTLEIELNEDENHILQIKSYDDPYQIAYDFCNSHNLNLLAVEVVEKKIIQAKRREELKLKFLKQAQIEEEKQLYFQSFDRKYSNPKQMLPHNNCNQDFMKNTQITKKREDLSRSRAQSKLSKQLSVSKINKNQRNQNESKKDEKTTKKLGHKESQAILSRACQSLYLRGKQKTKELQQKRMRRKQQLQQKQAEEYTFKPKLNEVSEKIIEFRKQTGTVAPRNASKAKQQATGQMYRQLQQCTFTPEINPISKIIVHNRESYLNELEHFQQNFNCQGEQSKDFSLPKRKPLSSIPSSHSFCNRKSKDYLLKQKQLEDKELFKPKLNPKSIEQVKEPFYARLQRAIETKQRIKQGEYGNNEYSFQPQIGRSPLYQALRGQNSMINKENVPVWEVLYKEGQSRIKQKQKLQENKSRNELITSISRHDLQPSGFNNQTKNQLNITAVKASTNLHYENLIQKRINSVFELLDSDGDGLVSPNRIGIENLSKNTLIFLKPIFEEMDELDEQLSFTQFRKAVINLLNDSDTYKKGLFLSDNRRTQNQFTFTPTINPKSKQLAEGRNTSQIHIRLYEQGIKNLKRKEMYIQRQKAKKQEMELQECSFKPCLHLGRKEYHPSILDRKLSDIQFSVNQSNNSHFFLESQMSKLNSKDGDSY